MWLRSPSDKNGWFTLQNPTIRLFLTANGNKNPTIEGKTLLSGNITQPGCILLSEQAKKNLRVVEVMLILLMINAT